jgi:hypothetical protein
VVASYDGTESLSKTAARFQECISSDGFVRSAIASDSDLGQVRYGLAMSTARMNGIATATLARATTFQALYGAALPA